MAADFLSVLVKGLEELSIPFNNLSLERYHGYYTELIRWSKRYNITGLRGPGEIATRLFLDSLLYLKAFPDTYDRPPGRLLDVGSGGGFPGAVLKIARPWLKVTLLEPSRKKASFLRHLINKLELSGIMVVQNSIEEYAKAGTVTVFDIVVTKALFRTYDFIKKTAGLTSRGSTLILSKGPGFGEELEEVYSKLDIEAEKLRIETIDFRLPHTDIRRYLIRITL
jgi:16S rRNA (guanine527-N7)-methyltransferase